MIRLDGRRGIRTDAAQGGEIVTDAVLMCVKTVACRDTISLTVNLIATAKIGCSARIERRHLVIFARLDVCSMFY